MLPWGGSMQNKHKGFTLIELMVTIAVMAVIAAIAAPSFQAQIYNYELKKELNELASVLNEAKAIPKNDQVFKFSVGGDNDALDYVYQAIEKAKEL